MLELMGIFKNGKGDNCVLIYLCGVVPPGAKYGALSGVGVLGHSPHRGLDLGTLHELGL